MTGISLILFIVMFYKSKNVIDSGVEAKNQSQNEGQSSGRIQIEARCATTCFGLVIIPGMKQTEYSLRLICIFDRPGQSFGFQAVRYSARVKRL